MKLLEQFKKLSLSPSNIEKLRGLILQLGIEGKLTQKWREENSDVEPVNELLKRIEKEKSTLNNGKRKKSFLPINKDDCQFQAPTTWMFTRLGNITDVSTGYAFKSKEYVDKGVFISRVTNIGNDGLITKNKAVFVDKDIAKLKYNRFFLKEEDVLMVMVGGSLGKIGKVTKDILPSVLNQNQWKFTRYGNMNADFLILLLKHINNTQIVITKSTHGHLNQNSYLNSCVPLPPFEEQKKIVEKVNEILQVVNQLVTLTKKRIKLKEDFVESALSKLTSSENTSQEWNYLAPHFKTFFTEKKSVKSLRETILQLAVQGKLTKRWREENPNVEPASELLERIKKEKQQLIAEKKIKKEKPLSAIKDLDKPYQVPDFWSWCKLGDVCLRLIDGNYGELYPKKHEFIEQGVPFFTAAAVGQNFEIKHTKVKYISPKKHEALTKAQTTVKDILLTNRGAKVGDVAIIKDIMYEVSNIGPQVTRIAVSHDNIVNLYIMYCIASPAFQRTILELNSGSAMNFMNLTKTANMHIPLPPLEEQKTIVEKVNSLMKLCDGLEEQIIYSETQIELLMTSCLKEALEI